ncbi:MAG: hypothetical protein M1531_06950 [Chloroflexi bacterium]|nr:hypothetical protein [Chloroflexota bacterium]
MYGDSYLMLDYRDIADRFRQVGRDGMMVVYENHDRYDRSNVVVRDGTVAVYDKRARLPEMVHIDAGATVLRRSVINALPEGPSVSLEPVLQGLVAGGRLAAYRTEQRFYEVGSLGGLAEFEALVRAGGHRG